MLLLDRNGAFVADPWIDTADDAPLPDNAPPILSLTRLRQKRDMLLSSGIPLGVRLAPPETAEHVADMLGDLALVSIVFSKFRDGRGFTIARTLRERHGFAGEIRAAGELLPDQMHALVHCGFSTIVVGASEFLRSWHEAAVSIDSARRSAAEQRPLPLLRRVALPFGGERNGE